MNFKEWAKSVFYSFGTYIISKEDKEAFIDDEVFFYEDAFREFLCENKEEIEDLEIYLENGIIQGSFFYKGEYYYCCQDGEEFKIDYESDWDK